MKVKGFTGTAPFDVVIVAVIAIAYAQLNISFRLVDVLYDFSRRHAGSTIVEFLANFIFLFLAGLLWATYRRWTKSRVREGELERMIETIIPQVYLVLAPDNEIVTCNAFVKAMFGYEKDEVVGREVEFLYVEHRSAAADESEVCRILEKEEGFYIRRATGKKKDGTTFPLEVMAGGLEQKRGSVVVLHRMAENSPEAQEGQTSSLQDYAWRPSTA
jgi:PAS domain S-box-containing protein